MEGGGFRLRDRGRLKDRKDWERNRSMGPMNWKSEWKGDWKKDGSRASWRNSCIWAIYFTTGKFPGDKSSGNDKLHCTANSTYLSSDSSLQQSFHLTMCLASTGSNEKQSWGQSLYGCVCVLVCLPFLAAPPVHVLLCIYLGRRQIGCLKSLKPLQTLVPWWDHEKQLLLFQLLHHHDQVEKWDNGSGVKQHWANSCVFVNCSQVFKECNAPWS